MVGSVAFRLNDSHNHSPHLSEHVLGAVLSAPRGATRLILSPLEMQSRGPWRVSPHRGGAFGGGLQAPSVPSTLWVRTLSVVLSKWHHS